jgi:hypothetical protein
MGAARVRLMCAGAALFCLASIAAARAAEAPPSKWKMGKPIVTYWAGPGFPSGPPLTDASARLLAEGGWNLAWSQESTLPVAERHGLRALLTDPLLTPASLDDPEKRKALEALIERVKRQRAFYAYFLGDEPKATLFPGLGRLIRFLREKDPEHLAYSNLFPIGATNEQLGTEGAFTTAYQAYLDRFVADATPALLSYDHYQFRVNGDTPHYFQNLGMVRRKALDAGLPFLNIVQACTWSPAFRAPNVAQMRYLHYTTLAYGGLGVSHYVYSHPGHVPGVVDAEGNPTPVYGWLKVLNRDFSAIAGELQSLQSLGAYHSGMLPPGAEPLPPDAPFRLDPPLPAAELKPMQRTTGALLGVFGRTGKKAAAPTHVLVVNLDYDVETTLRVRGPGALEVFDPVSGKWSAAGGKTADLRLPGGGGKLLRVRARRN